MVVDSFPHGSLHGLLPAWWLVFPYYHENKVVIVGSAGRPLPWKVREEGVSRRRV